MKRGLSQQEAMAYVGVKRRTWEAHWAPRLTGMHQGVSLIYDRHDLDRLFDEMKTAAAGQQPAEDAANDGQAPQAQNAPWNGRPSNKEGRNTWAKKQRESTPQKTEPGKLTSGGKAPDFASVASAITKRRNAG